MCGKLPVTRGPHQNPQNSSKTHLPLRSLSWMPGPGHATTSSLRPSWRSGVTGSGFCPSSFLSLIGSRSIGWNGATP